MVLRFGAVWPHRKYRKVQKCHSSWSFVVSFGRLGYARTRETGKLHMWDFLRTQVRATNDRPHSLVWEVP